MNILILGAGGRENALAWKISQSPLCSQLYIAPGNPGTAQHGINLECGVNDFEKIKTLCVQYTIAMVVVGPEDPLVHGIYDFFQEHESLQTICLVGPSKVGAMLEGSKAFAKEFMMKYKIPTARYQEFDAHNYEAGLKYIQQHSLPIVLKADGLAAGKGVVIAETHEQALLTFSEMIQEKKFGEASAKVVIEEFLKGIECSVFILTDGTHYVLLPSAKDYKRIGEGDTGLNTGGMGAISPVPFINDAFMQKVTERILKPTIEGIATEGFAYKGFIFIGLIKVNEEPFVIEYNCRLGDPETEAILPRIENDLVELLQQLHQGKLNEATCIHSAQSATTIMLVSQGYPEEYEKGKLIEGIEAIKDSLVFHAGTKEINHKIVSNGGRVIAITSLAHSLNEALALANKNATAIQFEGKYFRKDIGWEF